VHRIGRTGRAGASGMALSLMTGSNDERLLADIEKLTKRKLPVEDLAVEAAPPGHRREGLRGDEARAERPAERPRRVRERDDERPARPRPSPPSAPRTTDDPFFSKPYEPPSQPALEGAGAPAEAARVAPRRSSRPVAALLGGVKR
jgi:superfamily II DNA/RNA helicase